MFFACVRLLIGFTLLVIIGGCQSLTIHISSQEIEPEKLAILKQSLSEISDKVKITELSIPKEFPNTVIAANPGYTNYGTLAAIKDLLWHLDFGEATELRFAQGNHFYLQNNLGIYLRNPTLQGVPTLPPFLRTQYCNITDATLMFKKDHSFELEYENPSNIMDLLTFSGNWMFNDKSLTLHNSEGTLLQQFLLSKQNKETQWGLRPADVYTPTIDADFSPFNCEFMIIYVQEEPI